jgi:glucose-1-phosphate adenylyltransferase
MLIEALEENAKEDSHEFGRDIIPKFLKDKRVYGFKHTGYWGYTRTPMEYWQTSMDLLYKRGGIDLLAWRVMTNLANKNVRDRQPAFIGPYAKIHNSLFYSGCQIEGTVINSILFPGVKVKKGAEVINSILFFDTIVDEGGCVHNAISDEAVVFKGRVEVGVKGENGLTIIGRKTIIPEGIRIWRGVMVSPDLKEGDLSGREYSYGQII